MSEPITIPEEDRLGGAVVIALTGLAGSGKDSVANHLVAKHGFAIARFSDPLKRLCCRLFGWDYERVNDLDYKEERSGHEPIAFSSYGVEAILQEQGVDSYDDATVFAVQRKLNQIAPGWTRRRILQWVGTDIFREEIDPHHWQKKGLSEVDRILSELSSRVVLADCRFPNEFEGMRDHFGAVVARVACLGRPSGTSQGGHESERYVNEIPADLELAAEFGDLDGLREYASQMANALGAPPVADDETAALAEDLSGSQSGCQFDGGDEADPPADDLDEAADVAHEAGLRGGEAEEAGEERGARERAGNGYLPYA